MERKNFSYDELGDSLIVSNKQEGDIVKNNYEVGDMIFSLTKEGKIASLEIREFSSFLESCGMNYNIADKLKNARFFVHDRNDALFLMLQIEFPENGLILTKNIPIVLPLTTIF